MTEAAHQTNAQHVFCRYDSPSWLGELVVDAVGTNMPRSVVDLGSGGGALSVAAVARWNLDELITVDLDNSTLHEISNALTQHSSVPHRHFNIDLMSLYEERYLEPLIGSIDLVVSNPPYRETNWTPEIGLILERAGFLESFKRCNNVPSDLVFLARALTLVRPGGYLSLILPDSMVSSDAMAPIRKMLLKAHHIKRVIQLSRRAFKKTDAQTYVVVIRKDATPGPTRIDRIVEDGSWSPSIVTLLGSDVTRMDYSFHSYGQILNETSGETLRTLGVQIKRGRLSSVELPHASDPTFHTCNFPVRPGEHLVLPPRKFSQDNLGPWAEKGDILLARVDRRLEQKIAFVSSGSALLSDCVLRLRCTPETRERVLDGLTSQAGKRQLIARSRGTGARHISIESILNIIV